MKDLRMQMVLSDHHPRNTTPSGAWYKINPKKRGPNHQVYCWRVKNDEINFLTNGQ